MATPELRIVGGDPRKEIRLPDKVNKVVITYLKDATNQLRGWVNQGRGRRVVGDVQNRPEDDEIEIDSVGEDILEGLLTRYRLPAYVFSEHRSFGSENPQVHGALDPFDNSSEYKRGLDTPMYTVLSFYDLHGQPIAGGVGDILRNRLFLSVNGENYLYDLMVKASRRISPATTTNIGDANFVLASYVGSNEYHPKFHHYFRRMLQDMSPKGRWYGSGGAYIYAYLASGAVGAYVMFDEPRSEIDPGLTLAKAAGCEVVTVKPDGTFEDYQFTPGRQHETVGLLVAACTPELRDEIIDYYMHPITPRRERVIYQAS